MSFKHPTNENNLFFEQDKRKWKGKTIEMQTRVTAGTILNLVTATCEVKCTN